MDSLMSMMHSQINRVISSAISGRVIPELQNNIGSLSSGQRDIESITSANNQDNSEDTVGLKTKITKKGSRSDVRDTGDVSSYNEPPLFPQHILPRNTSFRITTPYESPILFVNKKSQLQKNLFNSLDECLCCCFDTSSEKDPYFLMFLSTKAKRPCVEQAKIVQKDRFFNTIFLRNTQLATYNYELVK